MVKSSRNLTISLHQAWRRFFSVRFAKKTITLTGHLTGHFFMASNMIHAKAFQCTHFRLGSMHLLAGCSKAKQIDRGRIRNVKQGFCLLKGCVQTAGAEQLQSHPGTKPPCKGPSYVQSESRKDVEVLKVVNETGSRGGPV